MMAMATNRGTRLYASTDNRKYQDKKVQNFHSWPQFGYLLFYRLFSKRVPAIPVLIDDAAFHHKLAVKQEKVPLITMQYSEVKNLSMHHCT